MITLCAWICFWVRFVVLCWIEKDSLFSKLHKIRDGFLGFADDFGGAPVVLNLRLLSFNSEWKGSLFKSDCLLVFGQKILEPKKILILIEIIKLLIKLIIIIPCSSNSLKISL